MKKIGLLIFGLAFAAASAMPARAADLNVKTGWTGTTHDNIFAFAKRGDQYWAVSNWGLLLKRAGDSPWNKVTKSAGGSLLGIAFSPAGEGVAVGQNGVILEAKPNSDEWSPANSPVKDRLLAVASSSRGDFVAVGAFGTILYRAAGSSDWKKVEMQATSADAELPHVYDAIFVSDDDAVLVGENSLMIELKKGAVAAQVRFGETAKPQAKGKAEEQAGGAEEQTGAVTPSLFTITYCDGALVASGQRGMVLTRVLAPEDKGKDVGGKGLLADWQTSSISGNPDLYGLTCLRTGSLVGVSNNGLILTAVRHGSAFEWQPHSVGTSAEWLSSAIPVDNSNSVYVGGPSKILEVSFGDGK